MDTCRFKFQGTPHVLLRHERLEVFHDSLLYIGDRLCPDIEDRQLVTCIDLQAVCNYVRISEHPDHGAVHVSQMPDTARSRIVIFT